MQKFFVFLVFTLCLLIPIRPVCGADSTTFNPTTVAVIAKGTSSIPDGTIISWPVAQNPADWQNSDGSYNWLECNGQSISKTVYPELFALMGGQVPDLRGLFLRGADAGRGIDAGRTIGTYQADAVGPHTHPLSLWRHSADGGGIYAYAKWDGFDNSIWTRENTGSETRPKNVAVRYLVRARP